MVRRYAIPKVGDGVSQAILTDEQTGGFRPRYIWEMWGVYYSLVSEAAGIMTVDVDGTEVDHEWLEQRPDVTVIDGD